MKNVLIGSEWTKYLKKHKLTSKKQMELYSGVTWKYIPIYKIEDYYFSMTIRRGYKNITSLKRLISIWS